MSKSIIQRFRSTPTILINDDNVTVKAGDNGISGILRGYSITAPDMSKSTFTFQLLGSQGEVLYSKSSINKAANTVVLKDAESAYLAVPFSCSPSANFFNIVGDSETGATGVLTSNMTNALDGEIVTIGSKNYIFKNTLSGAANEVKIEPDVTASGTITSTSNANPIEDETIVIGSVTYRFRDTLLTANDIKIGTDGNATLTNLKAALNHEAGSGTAYGTGTVANPTISAPQNPGNFVLDWVLTVTARTSGAGGNLLVLTTSATNIAVSGSGTLENGASLGDTTLEHLKNAINAGTGAGTQYGTSTVANEDATCGAVISNSVTVTSKAEPGTSIPTLSTSIAFTWAATHLVGGGEAAARTFTVDLFIER